ncbi:MAG: glycosyltransferase [Gemmatimonadota bacterium]|nr:MAG: glycosyltransferase [Gemmatimonadota bacterium]
MVPMVSVLLPVRDGEATLPAAIDSIASQTFTDFEVVAVDDGSTDGSAGLLEAWQARDARVRVVRQAPAGIVGALETGRSKARGRYLARMDADDVALPGRFEAQCSLMEANPSWAVCGGHIEYFPPESVRDGARRYQTWLNSLETPNQVERDLFVECPLAHPTFFLRAASVREAGGYIDRGWPEDYDLLMRLWERGGRLGVVARTLLRWREGSDRLSRNDPTYSQDAFRRCKVHYLLQTLARNRGGVVVWGAGPLGKVFAREVRSAGGEVRAFIDLDPRKVGQTIHGATVVGPASIRSFTGAFCVAAVGQKGARAEIRKSLIEAGWRETEDFVAVA